MWVRVRVWSGGGGSKGCGWQLPGSGTDQWKACWLSKPGRHKRAEPRGDWLAAQEVEVECWRGESDGSPQIVGRGEAEGKLEGLSSNGWSRGDNGEGVRRLGMGQGQDQGQDTNAERGFLK